MMNNTNLSFVLIILLAISGCKSQKQEYSSFNGFAQGTTYHIVYRDGGKFTSEGLKAKVEKILHDFDLSCSLYNDSSIISRINRNEEIIPDTFFIEVFNKSKEISEMTDSAFDITVGPLVRAWGFGPDSHKNFNESKCDSLMKLVGFHKVRMVNNHIVKSDPAIELDVNAIAQGYSVDVVSRYFNDLGIESYLIEIGGEVRAKGKKGRAMWRIGIDRPEDDNMSPGAKLQAIITIKDRSLATSGNYRKFYIENGVKYSHTIDPKTGYPVKNQLLSVTILASECATADGIATACMVFGKDKSVEFLGRHKELEGYLIYSDESGNFKTWISPDLHKNISEEGKN
jgi:FAD:protein FMN transferase